MQQALLRCLFCFNKFVLFEIRKISVYFVNHSLGKLTIKCGKWHVLWICLNLFCFYNIRQCN